jgi:hypothetical protein
MTTKYPPRVGRVFGRLTVKGRADPPVPRKYVCVCECGNKISEYWSNLTSGRKRSCGCLRAEILAAKRNPKEATP